MSSITGGLRDAVRLPDQLLDWLLARLDPRRLTRLVVLTVLLAAAWLGPRASLGMLALPFLVVGLGLLLRWPWLGLPAVVLAAAFVPFRLGSGGSAVNIAMIGVAGLSGLWLFRSLLHRQLRLRSAPANLPWLIFCLVAGLSIVAGAALWSPWVVTKDNFLIVQGAQAALLVLSACAYWLGANEIAGRRELRGLTWLLLGLGLFFLLGQAGQLAPLPGPVRHLGSRLLFAGPVFRASVCGLAAGLAVFHVDLDRRWRLALLGLALAMVALPWWNGADWASGWLPAFVSLLVIATLYGWQRTGWRLAGPVAIAGLVAAMRILPRLASAESYSLDTRLIAWRGLVTLLEGRWLLGLGLASYWHYWRGVIGSIAYFEPDIGYWHYTYDPQVNLHNNYLDILGQMGIVGLLVFAWLLIALALPTLRRFAAEPPGFGKGYAAGALAALGGIAFAGMLGDWFIPFVYNIGLNGFRDSFLGWMVLGGVVVLDATAGESAEDAPT